jgi:hypothetical protein
MLTYADVCRRRAAGLSERGKRRHHQCVGPRYREVWGAGAHTCSLSLARSLSLSLPPMRWSEVSRSMGGRCGSGSMSSMTYAKSIAGVARWHGNADVCSRIYDVCSRMLTYAHVCSRMLTYAHVCSRMLTYAHVCSRMLTYAGGWGRIGADADVC